MARSKWDVASATLSAATGSGGTFTVSYPGNKSAEDYLGGTDHQLISQSSRILYAEKDEFTLAFGASNITVTMNTNIAMGLGETIYLHIDRSEGDGDVVDAAEDLARSAVMTAMEVVKVSLGAPETADADAVCTAEDLSGGSADDAIPVDGADASGGVATLDVPRALTFTSSGDDTGITFTATGTDVFGATVVETVTGANAGAAAGKKAFKTVTGVTISGATAGTISVGKGDVLGLPVFVADAVDLLAEAEDGATPTAGTLVVGATATPSATTGDVRGTYDPNSAADGTKVFELSLLVRSTSYKGATQYSG
jgi:hypothetical protein